MRALVADIGGTKSYLAVVERRDDRIRFLREELLETSRYRSLYTMAADFLRRGGERLRRACFAVAGPVTDHGCRAVNLPWAIDAARLERAIGVPGTRLINDFQSVGHGLAYLTRGDLMPLQRGRCEAGRPIALIGAGTGLGEGYLTRSGRSYEVHASEGGHADFAPRNEIEYGLHRYLASRHGHVSYERVLSGPGLTCVLAYLEEAGLARAGGNVREETAREDPAAVITRHGLDGSDPACALALDLFVSIYGAETGNLALKLLATGGVYVAGGIAPRILPKLAEGGFIRAFCDKGRHAAILERIPVRVVRNPRVGLLGAAALALGLGRTRVA